jgi:hypothetical protein
MRAARDLPLAFTVQPISRNDKLFYKQLLEDSWKVGVRFRVVAGDRQYDPAIPTIKGDKHVKGIRVRAYEKAPYKVYHPHP